MIAREVQSRFVLLCVRRETYCTSASRPPSRRTSRWCATTRTTCAPRSKPDRRRRESLTVRPYQSVPHSDTLTEKGSGGSQDSPHMTDDLRLSSRLLGNA